MLWKPHEDQVLYQYAGHISAEEIGKKFYPQKSKGSVLSRMRVLTKKRLIKWTQYQQQHPKRVWTEDRINFLIENFSKSSGKELTEFFGLSELRPKKHLRRKSLPVGKRDFAHYNETKKLWTEEEDQLLIYLHGFPLYKKRGFTLEHIGRILGRSARSIHHRIDHLRNTKQMKRKKSYAWTLKRERLRKAKKVNKRNVPKI